MNSKPLVLIADDDYEVRRILTIIISKAGFNTEEAANGREAVEKTAKLRPDFLLLDINMPVMDGFQA